MKFKPITHLHVKHSVAKLRVTGKRVGVTVTTGNQGKSPHRRLTGVLQKPHQACERAMISEGFLARTSRSDERRVGSNVQENLAGEAPRASGARLESPFSPDHKSNPKMRLRALDGASD
ncbi:hypothetical protein [Paraburkholderia sp. ZP32-5]|uniref:hypothetical protein n=1 Tax=Paraburkholderia sp. ZP32-5 TaxID=2883245 RepID=UPI001F3B71F8|nr:hypothetical protein [Paraburkholderia sp. ZP32-5]